MTDSCCGRPAVPPGWLKACRAAFMSARKGATFSRRIPFGPVLSAVDCTTGTGDWPLLSTGRYLILSCDKANALDTIAGFGISTVTYE